MLRILSPVSSAATLTAWGVWGAGNSSDRLRKAMVVSFFPHPSRCRPLTTAANRNYAEQWLGGKDAGELCDDERANPVVYAAGAAPPRL